MVLAYLLALPQLLYLHAPFHFVSYYQNMLLNFIQGLNPMTIKIAIFVAKYLSLHEEACSSMRSEGNISVQTGHCCNGAVVQ